MPELAMTPFLLIHLRVKMNPKAVLFDLDCTLADRVWSLEKYWNVFFNAFVDDRQDSTSEHVGARLKQAGDDSASSSRRLLEEAIRLHSGFSPSACGTPRRERTKAPSGP